jgi:hypothetical protein
MSGQDATLSLKQAKAQQERIQCHEDHQGPKPKGSDAQVEHLEKKVKHQG